MSKASAAAACAFILLSSCLTAPAFAQGPQAADGLPRYFNGITLESPLDLGEGERGGDETPPPTVLGRIEAIPTAVVRVVFAKDTNPEDYVPALKKLRSMTFPDGRKRKVYVMGELLDSDYLARYKWECDPRLGCTADESPGSKSHDYKTRITRYLEALDEYVDIWEVGNEVNGEWADESCVKNSEGACKHKKVGGKRVPSNPARPDITAAKIRFAADRVRDKKKPLALTLIHMPECVTWSDNTMFEWAATHLKPKLDGVPIDYLLVSYYEDNCDKGKLTIEKEDGRGLPDQNRRSLYWNGIFDRLAGLFPEVRHVGFGEIGYSDETETCEKDKLSFCDKDTKKFVGSKLAILNRYHGLQIYTPKYVGGHFWWNAQEDIMYDAFYSALKGNFKSAG